jgi:hypothetical protein
MFSKRFCVHSARVGACELHKCSVCTRLRKWPAPWRGVCQASSPSKDAVKSEGRDVDDLVERAEAALNKARAALDAQRNTSTVVVDNNATPSFIPTSFTFGAPLRTIPGTHAKPRKSPSQPSRVQSPRAKQGRPVRVSRVQTPDLHLAGRSPARAATASTLAPAGANAGKVKDGAAGAEEIGTGWQTRPSEAPSTQLQRSRAATRGAAQEFAEPLPEELVLIFQVRAHSMLTHANWPCLQQLQWRAPI